MALKKTNAQIQAAFKLRMRQAGFKQIAVWVHLEDQEKLKAYLSKLNKKREILK